MKFLPVYMPDLSGNELEYVKDCIQSGWISSLGEYVGRFGNIHIVENTRALPFALTYDRYIPERRFAKLTNRRHLLILVSFPP